MIKSVPMVAAAVEASDMDTLRSMADMVRDSLKKPALSCLAPWLATKSILLRWLAKKRSVAARMPAHRQGSFGGKGGGGGGSGKGAGRRQESGKAGRSIGPGRFDFGETVALSAG